MKCVEKGCNKKAGTKWSPYWCPEHDKERRDRITKNLTEMVESMKNMNQGKD